MQTLLKKSAYRRLTIEVSPIISLWLSNTIFSWVRFWQGQNSFAEILLGSRLLRSGTGLHLKWNGIFWLNFAYKLILILSKEMPKVKALQRSIFFHGQLVKLVLILQQFWIFHRKILYALILSRSSLRDCQIIWAITHKIHPILALNSSAVKSYYNRQPIVP